MRIATLTHEFLQPIRHVNQRASGGSYVAIFTLRLAPALDTPGVRFTSEVSQPEAAPWIPSIERGVQEFVKQREGDGRPVGYLRVALVDIYVHSHDSKETAFMRAAFMSMSQAFEAHEVLLDETT